MKVFQSCGKAGWLKVWVDNSEAICLKFRMKVYVSVSYTCASDCTADCISSPAVKMIDSSKIRTTCLGVEERGTGDALNEEFNESIEQVDGRNYNLFSSLLEELHTENESRADNQSSSNNHGELFSGTRISVDDKILENHNDKGKDKVRTNSKGKQNNFLDHTDDSIIIGALIEDGRRFDKSNDEEAEYYPVKETEDATGQEATVISDKEKDETNKEEREEDALKHSSRSSGGDLDFIGNCSGKSELNSGINTTNIKRWLPLKMSVRKGVNKSSSVHKCNICQKEFADRQSLTSHHRVENRKEICPICNLECQSKFYLVIHKYLMHSDHDAATKREKLCPVCSKPFSKQSEILTHIRSQHTQEGLCCCCVCHAVFKNYQTFNAHLDFFIKHKKCRGETKKSWNESDQNCKSSLSTIKTKPLSVVLTRLPREKIDLSTHFSLSSAIEINTPSHPLASITNHDKNILTHPSPTSTPEIYSQPHPSSSSPTEINSPNLPSPTVTNGINSSTHPTPSPATKINNSSTHPTPSTANDINSLSHPAPLPTKEKIILPDLLFLETQLKSLVMSFIDTKPVKSKQNVPLSERKVTEQAESSKTCLSQNRPASQRLMMKVRNGISTKSPLNLNQKPAKILDSHPNGKPAGFSLPIRKSPLQPPLKRPADPSLEEMCSQPPLKKPVRVMQAPLGLGQAERDLNLSSAGQIFPVQINKSKKHVRNRPSGSGSSKEEEYYDNVNIGSPVGVQTSKPLDLKSSYKKSSCYWSKPTKCQFCERVFRNKQGYEGHKKPCRITQMCKECGYTTTSKASYLIHQYQKHTANSSCDSNSDRYTKANEDLHCHICEEPVAHNEILIHIMNKHTGEHPFECCVCKAPSKSSDEWISHGKNHLRSSEEKAKLLENKLTLCLSFKPAIPEKIDQVFCSLCNTYFSTNKEFVQHHKPESKNRECGICKVVCHSDAGFMIHRYISHGVLGDGTAAPAELSASVSGKLMMWHEDEVSNDSKTETRKCLTCSDVLPIKDMLSHVMSSHTNESPYQCCACKTEMPNLNQYIDHCDFHLGKKVFAAWTQRCRICDLRFELKAHWSRHRLMHKSTCPFCHVEFRSKALLDVHLKNLHINDMTACRYCKKMFADLSLLAEHERHHYFGKKSTCPVCGRLVKNFKEHMVRWHSEAGRDFVCNICGKKFFSFSDLRRHKDTHFIEPGYECDICQKKFKKLSGLQTHAQQHLNVHDRKFHECHVCGKKCSKPYNLRIHMRIHTPGKAFTCEHCGQGFNYNQSLQNHIRKKHTFPETDPGSDTTSTTTTTNSITISSATSFTTTTPAARIAQLPQQVSASTDSVHQPAVSTTATLSSSSKHPVDPNPSLQSQLIIFEESAALITPFQQSQSDVFNTEENCAQETPQQGPSMFYQPF